MLKVVVLISGSGSNLKALLDATSDPAFPAEVVAVGSDTDAPGLAFATAAGVATFVVRPADYETRDAWGQALAATIRTHGVGTGPNPGLVVSAGLMRILPAEFVRAFSPRLINTHPALLPLYPGAHAVRDALAARATETGVTVHIIDEGVDTGPVLRQARVTIFAGESESELHERMKQLERPLLVETVREIAAGALDLYTSLTDFAADAAAHEGVPMAVLSQDASLYEHRDQVAVRRALISVSDKSGLLDLATALVEAGIEIVSTGSTAATIREAGHPVTDVAEVTGFAEALDGRVKTLHPAVHSGLLADLRLADHREQLAQLGFAPFELVVVNLYPFEQTVAAGKPAADVIENVDIGGPAMVRATAKNHANAAIVVSPSRYSQVVDAVRAGGTTLALRRSLATEAFVHTAQYDAAVANWFLEQEDLDWDAATVHEDAEADPSIDSIFAETDAYVGYEVFGLREQVLRYGENSHQRAALFTETEGAGIAQATQLHGKEMSYNNYVDADAALRAAFDHERPAVAIIKHANPCGIAVAPEGAADPIAAAHERAHACDPVSAFGGVIAANRVVTARMAEAVAEIFTEVIVAPGFEPEALALLTQKKNVRLLVLPADFTQNPVELRQVSGGFLLQDADRSFAPASQWQLASGAPADAETLAELEFAWRSCRAVKSNAIILTRGGASVGVGMGQVNRVDSCRLAVDRAGDRAAGAVAASDAFFPFADGLQVLLEAGIRAVVQPGGSVRDAEVVAAAEAAGVTMYFTGERHFFH